MDRLPALEIDDESGTLACLMPLMESLGALEVSPFGLDLSGFYIEVVGVDSSTMCELNHAHRGKDSTTDVLSFPLVYEFDMCEDSIMQARGGESALPYEDKTESHSLDSHAPLLCLGSVVINLELAAHISQKLGHSVSDEVGLLFLHGFLHLLGYDHERDKGEQRAMEARLIRALKLPQSLIERAQGH